MPASRVNRLLRLINLLRSGRARAVEELAAEMNVSRRTLFRDLNALEAAGIHHYYDADHGYRLSRGLELPAVSLTVPETLGLMLLAKTAAMHRGEPLQDAAISAINKLVLTVPEHVRNACADLMSRVTVDPGALPQTSAESEHYVTLQRCVDEGRECRLVYKGPADKDPLTCRLKPYALHFAPRGWYVLGKTDAHREVRMFKLSRIQVLLALDAMFAKPKRFKITDKLGLAWKLIPEGTVHTIDLEFSPRVGSTVAEVKWHPTQKHRMLADGRCRMTFEVDGLSEIAWWVCGYADQVKVISPPELREKVVEMMKAAIKLYEA